MDSELCEHIREVREVQLPDQPTCVVCVQTGDRWVHLRTCQACGQTHCCDSSANRHATKHAWDSGHPVVASAEPGERWLWCYPDKQFVQY
ncbi:MAG: UBP-type zinc finger domain-containing protein [Myxococcales bacterium]|nr:UBP-type zinc finger domain-containing protein [Myxococcales bacterium]